MSTTYTTTTISSTTIKVSVSAKPMTIAEKVWNKLAKITSAQKLEFQEKAKSKWGIDPMDWYIYRTSSMKPYSYIYECIYNSAISHSLSPEFIHAVVMGEGLNLLIENLRSTNTPFDPDFVIDAYAYLGADEIGSSIDKLVKNGYIDISHKKNIVPNNVVNELYQPKVSAFVSGFKTGIEIVVAELHARKDWIKNYISSNSLTADTSNSDTIDFLTYATYNNMSVGMEAAKNISHYMRKFKGTERSDQTNVRFNTLKRLATADWYKNAKVYEI